MAFTFWKKGKDDAKLKEIFDTTFALLPNQSRHSMERVWWRNILYLMGEQYLEWAISLQSFRRKGGSHPHKPTPVDNIIRDYIRSMKAMVLNKNFGVAIWPNSNEIADKEAARAGRDIVSYMDIERNEDLRDEFELVLLWIFTCGTGFLRTFPFKGYEFFGLDKAGIVPECEVLTESILPFNVLVDNLGHKLKHKRWIGIKSLKSREWVADTFPEAKDVAESQPNLLDYERRLMQMVANVSPWKGAGLETHLGDMKLEDLTIFKEMEFAPTKSFPNGRYVAFVGDKKVLDHENLPIPTVKINGVSRWFYSITDFHYNKTPGRFWSDGGVTDLISPQNSINEIDQALVENRKGLGRPVVIIPSNVALQRLHKHGTSFIALRYNARMSGGAKPEIQSGTALPEAVIKERQIQREAVQDLTGDPKNILRGRTPTATASGVMVDILRETAEASHQPDVMSIYRAVKRVYQKQLVLFGQIATEERMIKIVGEGNEITVKNYRGADLRDNYDIRLELQSGVSSTRSGQTQIVLDLVDKGLFPNIAVDLSLRQEVLRRLGLSGFKETVSPDYERAELENLTVKGDPEALMYRIADPQDPTGQSVIEVNADPIFKFDAHEIHLEVHRKMIVSREFMEWPVESQAALYRHAETHFTAIELQQYRDAMNAQGPDQMTQDEAEAVNTDRSAGGAPSSAPTGGAGAV